VTRAEALAANALLTNTAKLSAYGRAFLTSLERALGAHAASDRDWDRKQSRAAAGFARAEATLLDARPALEAALRRAVDEAVPGARLSLPVARKATAQVSKQALPAPLVSLLSAFGFAKAEIASIRAQMARVAPSAVAGAVSAKLAPPALAQLERRTARSLRAIAARLEKR
jgi:hypothetical protein